MNRIIVLQDLMKRKRRREECEYENAIIATIISELMDELNKHFQPRSASLYRKRWDSKYLRDLAEKENSFVAEYRLAPRQFDTLHEMIAHMIDKNQEMATRAMAKCKSEVITTCSRLGAALIILAGGRHVEAMRTHGLSKPFVYANLHDVVKAINTHPSLEIKYDSSIASLKKRAKEFQNRGQFGLFEYMTDAVDGILIRIEAPKRMKKQKPILNSVRSHHQ